MRIRSIQMTGLPILALSAALIAGVGLFDVALAQRAHNADLYFRATIGPGHAESRVHSIDTGQAFELTGEGIDYSVAFGAITVPNWAVHVTFFGWNMFTPTPKYENDALNPSTKLSLFAWGAGITYIWMPINVYFTVSPAFSQLRTSGPELTDDTNDVGWAVETSIGKEWWFSETTAWGFAIGGSYHSNRSAVIVDRKWKGYSASVRLSITTN